MKETLAERNGAIRKAKAEGEMKKPEAPPSPFPLPPSDPLARDAEAIGRGNAEAGKSNSSPFPLPSSPFASIAVSSARVAFVLWQRDGDCLFDPKEATCDAIITAGVSLREAWHAAVDTACDRIEEMKRGG